MKNLTVEITDKCSLACRHCSTFGAWDREDNTISLADFLEILNANPDYREVRLSGGEPFMHPDLVRFVKEVKQRNKLIQILSCGVFREGNTYSPVPEELIRACSGIVNTISFSLHGSKETHEEVVGIPDTFQYLDETINQVVRFGIPFSFGFVPLKTNYWDLEGAVNYASRKAGQQDFCHPKLYLLRYVKQGGNQYDKKNTREDLAISPEQNLQVIAEARRLSRQYGIDIVPTCSMLEDACTAGFGKKVVTVCGEEVDCSALKWSYQPDLSTSVACKCKDRH